MQNKVKEFFRELFGYKYILNERSREVHNPDHEHVNCHLDMISHKRYITKRRFNKLYKAGRVDGCRYCIPSKDNG